MQSGHAPSHVPLEQVAAAHEQRETGGEAGSKTRGREPLEIVRTVYGHRARFFELLAQAGKEPVGDHAPPYHERVQVPGLRDSLAELGSFGKLVPLDDSRPLEALGQRPQDRESHHAAADDQRVSASARMRVCSA